MQVQVFSNISFWILPDPPLIGLIICNDPRWLECRAPLSKLRIRQLPTDEKGLVICLRELFNGFKHKNTRLGLSSCGKFHPTLMIHQ